MEITSRNCLWSLQLCFNAYGKFYFHSPVWKLIRTSPQPQPKASASGGTSRSRGWVVLLWGRWRCCCWCQWMHVCIGTTDNATLRWIQVAQFRTKEEPWHCPPVSPPSSCTCVFPLLSSQTNFLLSTLLMLAASSSQRMLPPKSLIRLSERWERLIPSFPCSYLHSVCWWWALLCNHIWCSPSTFPYRSARLSSRQVVGGSWFSPNVRRYLPQGLRRGARLRCNPQNPAARWRSFRRIQLSPTPLKCHTVIERMNERTTCKKSCAWLKTNQSKNDLQVQTIEPFAVVFTQTQTPWWNCILQQQITCLFPNIFCCAPNSLSCLQKSLNNGPPCANFMCNDMNFTHHPKCNEGTGRKSATCPCCACFSLVCTMKGCRRPCFRLDKRIGRNAHKSALSGTSCCSCLPRKKVHPAFHQTWQWFSTGKDCSCLLPAASRRIPLFVHGMRNKSCEWVLFGSWNGSFTLPILMTALVSRKLPSIEDNSRTMSQTFEWKNVVFCPQNSWIPCPHTSTQQRFDVGDHARQLSV